MTCTIVGCSRPSIARGWCDPHYRRWRRWGDPMQVTVPATPREERGPYAGCWEWTGATAYYGYGKVGLDGRTTRVHRAVYEAIFGPIPDGLFVLHRCDNPPCFRPDHLFLGTAGDNFHDMLAKGRANPFGGDPAAAQVEAMRSRVCGRR